jgi:acyl-coenzyme A thioesterase PaaI-like protein
VTTLCPGWVGFKPGDRGRRFLVVETELRDDQGRLVAKVTQTQAVL